MYAELVRDIAPDERARLDEELALPIGVTAQVIDERRAAVLASHGWT